VPAASPIDMTAPLGRRRALIQKLKSQMARVNMGSHASSGFLGSGYTGAHSSGSTMGSVVPFNVPEGIAAAAPATESLSTAADPTINPGGPDASASGDTGGSAAAPVADVPGWQTAGFVSEDAQNAFTDLPVNVQQRINENPVARRRYFT
jgi:hypothetical protein